MENISAMSEPNEYPNQDNLKSEKECLFCHNKNPHDYQYCSSCGSSLIYKNCANCFFASPIEARFCPNCGSNIEISNIIPYRNKLFDLPGQSTYISGYVYNYYYEKPKWWNLPVFFIIFSIFGLLVLSSLISVILVAIIGMTEFNFAETIYLDMFTKLVQLLIIILALKYFTGLKTIFSNNNPYPEFNNTNNSEKVGNLQSLSNQNIDGQEQVKTSKKPNLLTKSLFLLLFVFILLIIDLYTDVIISFLKDLFHTGSTTSAYSFLDSGISQNLILIIFWIVIFAPIHEEFLFRGILQQGLNKTSTSDFSHYIIQGTSFAFMHLAGDILNGGSIDFVMLHMISTFMFGVSATFLRKKFKSLIWPILLHSFSNGLSISFIFISTPYFTENQLNIISTLIYILPIVFALVILSVLYVFKQWRINKPLSFSQPKNKNFIIRALLIALIFNIAQYVYIILPITQQALYVIFLGIISIVIFIYWGKKTKDLTWSTFLKKDQTDRS